MVLLYHADSVSGRVEVGGIVREAVGDSFGFDGLADVYSYIFVRMRTICGRLVRRTVTFDVDPVEGCSGDDTRREVLFL